MFRCTCGRCFRKILLASGKSVFRFFVRTRGERRKKRVPPCYSAQLEKSVANFSNKISRYVQIVVFRALSYSPHSQASVGAASALPAPSTSSGGFLSLIHVYPSNSVPHVVQKITSWVLLPTFALWTLLGAYWIAEVSLSDKMCAGVGGHQELGSTSSTSGVGGGLTQSGAGQINSTTSSKVVGSLDHPPRTTEVSGQQQSGNDQLRAAVENMIPHRFFPPGLDGIPPYFFPVWVLFCMLWTLVHIALVGLWQLNLRAVSEGADPIIGCDFSREMIFVSSRRVDEMNTRSSRRGRRVCRSSRRRGLSRAQIASMPTRIATPQDVFVGAGKDHPGSGRTTIAEFFKGETECSICLQAFEAGEILKFPCARCRCCFHEACIDAWYLQRNSCPHCRKKHRRWPEV